MKKLKRNQFTSGQYAALYYTLPGHPVRDINVFRKLSKLGVLKLHDHTGEIVRHVWGMLVRAWYIDEAESFEVESVGIFHQRYISGSFFPYLVRAELDEQGRIKY